MSKIQLATGVSQNQVPVLPPPVLSGRDPTSNDTNFSVGQLWYNSTSGELFINEGSGVWNTSGEEQATETVAGIAEIASAAEATAGTDDTKIMTPAKVALVAIAGAPDWSEVTKGIVRKSTQAEAEAATDDNVGMTPLKVAEQLAAGNVPGSFTSLDASGAVTFNSTGAIAMTSDTASSFGTTGGGIDLTLSSAAGRVIVNGEEAAANAITLLSAAGGIDADAALQINIATSQNAADALVLSSSAGGIDITAAGASGEDIDLVNTAGSINLTAGEAVADSIVFTSSAGGIDITAAGGAGLDTDIVNTSGSVHISGGEAVADAITLSAAAGGITQSCVGQLALSSSQNAADAITITSSAGGTQILVTGTAGEDLVLSAAGSSITATATENAALAIYLHANGGTSETVDIHSDQGTGVASINVHSDVGGLTFTSGLASADAVNIVASDAAGGIDIDSGTAGFIVDTTGAVSLDSAAASNFTVTGAFDLTLQSTAGSVNVSAGEAAADSISVQAAAGGLDLNVALQANIDSSQAAANAVRIIASDAAGGLDLDCGTGGATLDSTGAISLDSAAASNFTVTGAFDLTLSSTAGSTVITGGEAAVDAITITAGNAAGGIDMNAGTGGVTVDTTAAISLDSATASNFTVTGAADLTLNSTAGAVNITSGEANADSILITSGGGAQLTATGAAGKDVLITCTSGSMTLTAGENVTDAMNITASGAASRVVVTAGTGSISLSSGQIVATTAVANADSPYTVLGTDYFLAVDTSAGVVTVTLPAATAVAGQTFVIRDVGGAAAVNNITIGGAGTNLVGGGAAAASKTLSAAYSGAVVYSDGTVWAYQYVA